MKIKEFTIFYIDSIWAIFYRGAYPVTNMILVRIISSIKREILVDYFEKHKWIGYKEIIEIKKKWWKYTMVLGRDVPAHQRFGDYPNSVVAYKDEDLFAQKNVKKYGENFAVEIVDPLKHKGQIISLRELEKLSEENRKKDK